MLRFLRVVVVATVAANLCGCWEGTTRGVLATVLFVEGPAVIRPDLQGPLVPLTRRTHAGKGSSIETPDSARAAMALLPNLLVELDRNARLEILRLAITKDGNETGSAMQGRYADVELKKGRMIASHGWGEAIAKFKVITPHGELVTTSDALFCVESDENKTRVTCVSGSVGLQAREGETMTRIPPGFVGEWSASGSNMTAAESDAHGQETLQESLEVEEKLRGLIRQNRYLLPR